MVIVKIQRATWKHSKRAPNSTSESREDLRKGATQGENGRCRSRNGQRMAGRGVEWATALSEGAAAILGGEQTGQFSRTLNQGTCEEVRVSSSLTPTPSHSQSLHCTEASSLERLVLSFS